MIFNGVFKIIHIYNQNLDGEYPATLSNKIMTVWIEMYNKTMLNKKPKVCCGISCIDIISGDVITFQNQEEYMEIIFLIGN